MSSENNDKNYLGGFPPISSVVQNKKKDEEDKKIRGFSIEQQKDVVSLKEIMKDRRTETKPFIVF
jgi:hypothetical protein